MRACVLSGGASKGAYQAGVLKRWMGDDGIDYDILCGVSVGGINSAFISQYPKGQAKEASEALLAMWARVSTDKVYKPWSRFLNWLKPLWSPLEAAPGLWHESIFDSKPLWTWIQSELRQDAIHKSGRLLRVGCVSWDLGVYKFATELEPEIAKWVIASSSYPLAMLPIEIDGHLWSDGGIRSVTPIGEAIRLGADEIDVVMCTNPELPPGKWDPKGANAIPGYAYRMLDIQSDEVVRKDLKECGLKNDIAERGGDYKRVKIRAVWPQAGLVRNSLVFDPREVQHMIEVGYQDAMSPRIL